MNYLEMSEEITSTSIEHHIMLAKENSKEVYGHVICSNSQKRSNDAFIAGRNRVDFMILGKSKKDEEKEQIRVLWNIHYALVPIITGCWRRATITTKGKGRTGGGKRLEGEIVKTERCDKKSYKFGTSLYQEKSWFIGWAEEANATAFCKNCFCQEFLND